MRSRTASQRWAGEWQNRLRERLAASPRLARTGNLLRSISATLVSPAVKLVQSAHTVWEAPRLRQWRIAAAPWVGDPLTGSGVLLAGTAFITVFIFALNYVTATTLPSPGLLYLPLVAMLAYHWGWRHATIGGILELVCVYFFFIPPISALKPVGPRGVEQLITLAAVTTFVLALVQLARSRRSLAEREAGRFAALNRVGTALAGELHETPLLQMIARTARELTGAEFAAFTLRPVDAHGRPLVPSEGHLFHLAAAVGVTPEQEAFFERTPLGGEGLLAPIFRHGVPVRVADALAMADHPAPPGATGMRQPPESSSVPPPSRQDAARQTAMKYAHGHLPGEALQYIGVPRGHPRVRSFLGAPLLDRTGEIRGGLLLGHSRADQFSEEDEALLVALAAQASVALENARHYRAASLQAQELDATFESITDGVVLVDDRGEVLRENGAARQLREALERAEGVGAAAALVQQAGARARGESKEDTATITVIDGHGEQRAYVVSAAPLRPLERDTAAPAGGDSRVPHLSQTERPAGGTVIVWHDVTEAQRLVAEQRAHAEADARRSLLQTVIEALPSGVYLVRGPEAHLVLANRAAADVWGAPWLPGQSMSEFLATSGTHMFGPDGHPLTLEELVTLHTVRTGEAILHHQEVIRQPGGHSLPVLLNAVALDAEALGWPATEPVGEVADRFTPASQMIPERAALVVLQDVSALKAAERLKDDFIGIAAHELRTPMAAVRGFAQTLALQTARGKGPPLEDWQREAIHDIDTATARLVELTDDLLDVTRLQGGRLELHREPADVVALAQRVAARLRVTSERHTINVIAETEHVVALIDSARIEQVLGNLISNAIKYSPHGGVIDVTVREFHDHQHVGVAELGVRDYGIGIPASQHSNIFGRFARAENARDLGITGTGLGLFICRELVELHGGRIRFESEEGKGSTFYVSLPLAVGSDDLPETPALHSQV